MLTQEDYNNIKKVLVEGAVKDTDFLDSALPLDGTEVVAIVQQGKNVKVSVKELSNPTPELKVEDFLNITTEYGHSGITLSQAILYVPSDMRKVGQVITFLDNTNTWKIYQFYGTIGQWSDINQWENLHGNIVNNIVADEQDITLADGAMPEDPKIIMLKDKVYDSNKFDGKGRKYLKKSDSTVNWLTQADMSEGNTIYHIQYDFNLNGSTITIPDGCILLFEGGSITNGVLVGDNTSIVAGEYPIFRRYQQSVVSIRGTWDIPVITSKWFPFQDVEGTSQLKEFMLTQLMFLATGTTNIVYINEGNMALDGQDASVNILRVPSNTILDCSGTTFTFTQNNIIPLASVRDASNVEIRNLNGISTATATIEDGTVNCGIYITNSNNVKITGGNLSYFKNSAIKIDSSNIQSNIEIEGVSFVYNNRGIYARGVFDLFIKDSTFLRTFTSTDAGAIVIDSNNASQTNANVYINKCNIESANKAIYCPSTSTVTKYFFISDSNIIGDCDLMGDSLHIHSSNLQNLYISNSNKVRSTGNIITGAIDLDIVSDVMFTGCTFMPSDTYISTNDALFNIHEDITDVRVVDCRLSMPVSSVANGKYLVYSQTKNTTNHISFYNCDIEDKRTGGESSILIDYLNLYNCVITCDKFIAKGETTIVPEILSCYITNSSDVSVPVIDIQANIAGSSLINFSDNEVLYPSKNAIIKLDPSVDMKQKGIIFKNNSIPYEDVNSLMDILEGFGPHTYFNQPSYSSRLYGPSDNIPTLTDKEAGYKYFDTTRSLSLVWNGTEWINPDGTKTSKVTFV